MMTVCYLQIYVTDVADGEEREENTSVRTDTLIGEVCLAS